MSCLHELFPGLEAALIRDVYDNVNKDTPKAIEELLILQVCLPACLPNLFQLRVLLVRIVLTACAQS